MASLHLAAAGATLPVCAPVLLAANVVTAAFEPLLLARDEAPAAGNPLAGEEFWGRWSQNTKEIYLELYVDADTPAEKVRG